MKKDEPTEDPFGCVDIFCLFLIVLFLGCVRIIKRGERE